MIEIRIDYQGQLRCSAIHGPSGDSFATDAPVDNNGRGEAFSPTDLVGTSLGACMATVMGIVARQKEISLEGMKLSVRKHMSADSPRRISRLEVEASEYTKERETFQEENEELFIKNSELLQFIEQ